MNAKIGYLALTLILAAPRSDMAQSPSHAKVFKRAEQVRTVELAGDEQITKLEIRDIGLDLALADERTAQADVISLYDPESGLFWWKYQTADPSDRSDKIERFLKDYFIHIGADKISCFVLSTPPPTLWMRESGERFETSEEAQRHLQWTLAEEGESIARDPSYGYHTINLWHHLEGNFFYPVDSASPRLAASIYKVVRHDSTWDVVLEGSSEEKATVSLSDEFELLNVDVGGANRQSEDGAQDSPAPKLR